MAEKTFQPLSSPQKVRPSVQFAKAMRRNDLVTSIRDNFTLTTWLLIGGLLQGIAITAFGSLALLPTAMAIAYRTADHLLMLAGWKKNRYASEVLLTKFGAQMPSSDGTFGSTPADRPVVVFIIGAKSNHPLGLFGPDYKKIGTSFEAMVAELEASAEKSGFLGRSNWINRAEQEASNETMSVMYFRDYESLHRYAHGPLHMEAVKNWVKVVKRNPHIAIYHETYVVPKGNWENIYINSKPTGMSATSYPVRSGQGNGETVEWMSPIVDASKGPLRVAARRLQMNHLRGYEEEKDDIWNKTYVEGYGTSRT
ncbi:hypothetical protein AJ79_05454 [Helicocarpus griseus UAMH5409]|uniref:Uncharacterized protein n=1 Tax=Helicocarpus griseus UAMH5409 TaxID=1447875 RepID=A0A2B7XMZ9_9EURO|nr:hypothetical protein AJ79_05454 [Helicocarpus griseus UAMH5409]